MMKTLLSVGVDTGYGAVKARAVNPDFSTLTCCFESKVAQVTAPSKPDGQSAIKTWQTEDNGQWFQANGGSATEGYRETSSTYFLTAEYRALTKIMLGVLAQKLEAAKVNTLVIGLPLNQYETPKNRQILIDDFQKDHIVLHGGVEQHIRVEEVIVVPQPFGALTLFANPAQPEAILPSELCVLDIGNGTTDFIVCVDKRMNKDASRSVRHAMSELRSDLAGTLAKNGFYGISAEKINDFLCGRPTFVDGNLLRKKDIQQYLDMSVMKLVRKILNELPVIENTTMLLSGAAANLLLPAFKRELSNSVDIKVSPEPAFSNATGFSMIGLQN
jgi:hypothetical protein